MDIQNKKQWADAFFEACKTVHLEDLRHLCQKKYLDCGWADIHGEAEYGFRLACQYGHFEIVKYLLTSPKLKESGYTFADLHARHEIGFRFACQNGHLDIVKYLLTSHELKKAGHAWADLHVENENGFLSACENEQWNVVRWLVMEYGMEKTTFIEAIIQDYPQAQEYFRIREEVKEIQTTLENSIHNETKGLKKDERARKKSEKIVK